MSDKWLTRKTLLQRAQDTDNEQAWDEFVSYYEGFISIILHKMNLSRVDHDDLKQEILLKIWKNLSHFELDEKRAKFRTWLSTLIRNRVLDHFRKKQRQPDMDLLDETQLVSQPDLDAIIKKEWERHLTQVAMQNIKKLFSGSAIRAFELSLLGKDSEQICLELNIAKESVRTLKNRVKLRLVKEIQVLRSELEFKK
jgi:RNA polymerase sigma factor (sigma-70 family)